MPRPHQLHKKFLAPPCTDPRSARSCTARTRTQFRSTRCRTANPGPQMRLHACQPGTIAPRCCTSLGRKCPQHTNSWRDKAFLSCSRFQRGNTSLLHMYKAAALPRRQYCKTFLAGRQVPKTNCHPADSTSRCRLYYAKCGLQPRRGRCHQHPPGHLPRRHSRRHRNPCLALRWCPDHRHRCRHRRLRPHPEPQSR